MWRKVRPPKPQNIHVGDLTESSIAVTWDAVAGAMTYLVYLDGARVTETTDTHVVLTDLSPAQSYDIQLAAYNGIEGAKSEPLTQNTRALAPELQPYKKNTSYLLGTGMQKETITNCRIYKHGVNTHFATGVVTMGDLKIYLNGNANIVTGEQYDVCLLDGDPNSNFVLGLPATFTVLAS